MTGRDLARLDKARRRALCAYCAHDIASVVEVQGRRHLIMPLAMKKIANRWRKVRLQRPVRPGLRHRDPDGQVIYVATPPGEVAGRVEWDLPADVTCPRCAWRQRLDAAALDVVSGHDSDDVLLMRAVPLETPGRIAGGSRSCACTHTLAEHVRAALNDDDGARCLVDNCMCMIFRQSATVHQAERVRPAVGMHDAFYFFRDSTRPLSLDIRRAHRRD